MIERGTVVRSMWVGIASEGWLIVRWAIVRTISCSPENILTLL